ncbi:MAG TPA: chorismate synthase [Rhabdochlamydiaceae bacterium]|nr:chorismate synthase [Rhabdochlamydiaceae bacterium]
MASNSFGTIFRITTWGESHGKAVGVVIDGCPAGLELTEDDIDQELVLRQPGKRNYTSPRAEKDEAQIFSGVFEGKTTGAPISIVIFNTDIDSSKYEPIKDLLRPGHANFTYLEKYGVFDHRGGGRASARETVCRVAAGAVAKKLLKIYKIQLTAFIKEIGGVAIDDLDVQDLEKLKQDILESSIFCPDPIAAAKMIEKLEEVKHEGDSLGGVIEVIASIPIGLGDPVYEKLEANLAKAMLSLPATKGIEIGSGFHAASMKGSDHNDQFALDHDGNVITTTNFAGGTLGGISSGMPLIFRVAFKPPSSIMKSQQTVNLEKQKKEFQLPRGSRHDPCVAIRAVPIIEAMTALVLADALLLNQCARLRMEPEYMTKQFSAH